LDTRNKASGYLYLDDGETVEYATDNSKTLVSYNYFDGALYVKKEISNEYVYDGAATKLITDARFFGLP